MTGVRMTQEQFDAILARRKPVAEMLARQTKKSKYGNHKVKFNGQTFDSKAEYRRWVTLQAMTNRGDITNLQRQVAYELIPACTRQGKTAQRACKYVADFVYEKDGRRVVEDVKGVRTAEYKIKAKLMLWIHGIEIYEVKVK